MAVDKIIIEVTGDAKGVDKTIDQLEKVGKVDKENAAQFEKHNKQFQKAVGESSKAVNQHVESLKSLVPAVTAAFAVQTVIAFGKASLNAFIEAERGEKLLLNALGKNEAAFKRLTEAAKKYQATTVYDDDTIIAAQTFLATQGRTEEQINKVIKAATNLSAVTGDSLQSSVEKLDATYEGSIGRFGKLDSRLKSLTLTQLENGVAVDMLAEKYAGFAEAELETTAGKLRRLENAWGEVKETVGAAIVDMADKIRDNTLTGGLIDRLLFGESQELKDSLLKIKLVQGSMADLNADMGEFEDARAKDAAKTIEAQKAQEKQIRNVAFLKSEIARLTKELDANGKSVEQNKADHAELVKIQNELAAILGKTTDAIKEQKKELDKPVQLEDALGGTLDVADYELKQKEIAETNKKTTDAIKDNEDDLMKHIDKLHKEQDDKDKKASDERIRLAEEEAQRRIEIQQELSNAIGQLINIGFQQAQSQEQQETDFFLQNLEIRRNAGEISDQEYTKLRKKFLQQQAQDQHDLAVFQATVNGALAVINAITTGDPYTAAARAAIAGAIAAAEIAVIASQPIPQFAKGGKVKGKSHREGGVHAELEGDEFVISKKAARKIGFDNLEMLNKGIVPVKLLKQGLSDGREKRMENTLKAVFGSNDFDTYPIEKLLKKSIQNDRQVAQYLVKELKGSTRKRGGLR